MSPRRREAFEAGGLNVKNCNASSRLSGRDVNAKGEELCRHGCGGDTCKKMTPLPVTRIVNLGEIGAPMNGAFWTSSHRWPLTTKMARTDFQPASVGRLERLSQFDIAWVNPAKRPAQSTIAAGDSTIDALALQQPEYRYGNLDRWRCDRKRSEYNLWQR
jgi:hypothetical protein